MNVFKNPTWVCSIYSEFDPFMLSWNGSCTSVSLIVIHFLFYSSFLFTASDLLTSIFLQTNTDMSTIANKALKFLHLELDSICLSSVTMSQCVGHGVLLLYYEPYKYIYIVIMSHISIYYAASSVVAHVATLLHLVVSCCCSWFCTYAFSLSNINNLLLHAIVYVIPL